jgi:hypothetical protein
MEERVQEKGRVKEEFIRKHNLTTQSAPQDWLVRAFLPDEYEAKKCGDMRQNTNTMCFRLEKWCSYTNLKAVLSNAGTEGHIYPDWTPFTQTEIEMHLGLHILNGLSPSPQVKMKSQDPVNGNDAVHKAFDPNAERRH